MRTFQDNAGRVWTIAVNVDAVKRVRDLLKEDLLDVKGTLTRILVDPILLCDVLYCVCKPEADAEKITDVDFARAMAGDAIRKAKEAFVEELIDFFPEPNQREAIRMVLEKWGELGQLMLQKLKVQLQRADLPREIEAALSGIGESSTSSQESSESTQDR